MRRPSASADRRRRPSAPLSVAARRAARRTPPVPLGADRLTGQCRNPQPPCRDCASGLAKFAMEASSMPFLATMRLAGCGVGAGQLAVLDLGVAEFNAASMPAPVSGFSSRAAVLLAPGRHLQVGLPALSTTRLADGVVITSASTTRRLPNGARQAADARLPGPRWLSPSPRQLGMRYARCPARSRYRTQGGQ
jgi:hypothetical protein